MSPRKNETVYAKDQTLGTLYICLSGPFPHALKSSDPDDRHDRSPSLVGEEIPRHERSETQSQYQSRAVGALAKASFRGTYNSLLDGSG